MVRCGLIGCGRIVEDIHIRAFSAIEDLEIAAICDINPVIINSFGDKYKIKLRYDNVEAFLDENLDLDFVSIATPGFTHFELCEKVIKKGINLLVEKPVTLNLREAVSLKSMAEKNGVKLCVMQNYRFREPVIKAKKALDRGLLGEVYQVNSVLHLGSLYNEPSSWSWQERKNKVLLYELSIHLLDLQTYFAGSINKIIGIKYKYSKHLDCTTHIYALIEFQSGAVGIIDIQLFASSNYMHFEVFGTANDVRIKFRPHYYRIYSGTVNPIDELYYDFRRIWDFAIPVIKEIFIKPSIPRRVMSHFLLIKQFVDSLRRDNIPNPVPMESVLPTMEILEELAKVVYQSQ